MIPGRVNCTEGWSKGYNGYLMSAKYDEAGTRNWICIDNAPEVATSVLDVSRGKLWPVVQETRAQIWPNLAPEYICRIMIDCLSPDSSLFKSAGCQTVNFGQLILFAFEKKK